MTVDVVELNLNVRRRRQRILAEILLRACGLGLVRGAAKRAPRQGRAGSVPALRPQRQRAHKLAPQLGTTLMERSNYGTRSQILLAGVESVFLNHYSSKPQLPARKTDSDGDPHLGLTFAPRKLPFFPAQAAAPALGLSAVAGLVPPATRFAAAGRPASICSGARRDAKRRATRWRSIMSVACAAAPSRTSQRSFPYESPMSCLRVDAARAQPGIPLEVDFDIDLCQLSCELS